MFINIGINLSLKTCPSSISESLTFIYHRCNNRKEIPQKTFKDLLARNISDAKNYSEFIEFLTNKQKNNNLTSYHHAIFWLITVTNEISNILKCSKESVVESLETHYFKHKSSYKAFAVIPELNFVHEVSWSEELSHIDTKDNMCVLVLAGNRRRASAVAHDRLKHPINPLKLKPSNLHGVQDSEILKPMIGSAISEDFAFFQASNPLTLFFNFLGSDQPPLDFLKNQDLFIFEAAAYFEESIREFQVGDNEYILPTFWGIYDTDRDNFIDQHQILKNVDGNQSISMDKIEKLCNDHQSRALFHCGMESEFTNSGFNRVVDVCQLKDIPGATNLQLNIIQSVHKAYNTGNL